jgi:hypothetical protein
MAMDNETDGSRDIEAYLALARAHGETSDTREWVADLEDIARVAWRLMTEDQKAAFRLDAEIVALAEATGDFADEQNADF